MPPPPGSWRQAERSEDSLTAKNIGRFAQLRAIQRDYVASHPQSTIFIDVNELLCPGNRCESTTLAGDTIRPDNLHFSLAGSKYLAPRLTQSIETALQKWFATNATNSN